MIICPECKKCLPPPMFKGKSKKCTTCSPPVIKKKKQVRKFIKEYK